MTEPFIIAIDGPAASGKGTLAKKLAARYGLAHFDTGLTYRAVADAMLACHMDLADEAAAVRLAQKLDFANLDAERLGRHAIGEAASKIAVLPGLRQALVAIQRRMAQKPPGAVIDGRDIGTVVCPHADVKLYITADVEERARRRFHQINAGANSAVYDYILADLQQRDRRDMSREESPLKRAQDAYLLNTTKLSIEEAFKAACRLIDNKRTGCSGFRPEG